MNLKGVYLDDLIKTLEETSKHISFEHSKPKKFSGVTLPETYYIRNFSEVIIRISWDKDFFSDKTKVEVKDSVMDLFNRYNNSFKDKYGKALPYKH